MKKKIFLRSFALANFVAFVLLLIALAVHLSAFSYTRQSIAEKMFSQNVVSSSENQGVIVYVVKLDNGYVTYNFSTGVFNNRLRLQRRFEYEYNFHELAWSMRNNFFTHVIIRGEDIRFHISGRRISRFQASSTALTFAMSYLYICIACYRMFKKKLCKTLQSEKNI
jgi:hypothetical protein